MDGARGVYVAGVMRSGTTWLGICMAEHLDYVCVGELSGVLRDAARAGFCACGQPIVECPAWAGPLARLHTSGDPATTYADLNRQFNGEFRSRFVLKLLMRSWMNRPGSTISDVMSGLVDGVVDASNTRGFVDTSKKLGLWAFHLGRAQDLSVVHIIRDPWCVARSDKETRQFARSGNHFMPPGATALRSSLTWTGHNAALMLMGHLSRSPYVLTSYERLLEDPSREVERLGSVLCLEPHRGPTGRANHVAVGNPSRILGSSAHQAPADKPRLSRAEQLQVRLVTAPVRWWLRRIGLENYRPPVEPIRSSLRSLNPLRATTPRALDTTRQSTRSPSADRLEPSNR